MKYTKEEIDFICNNYKNINSENMSIYLNRSLNAIKIKKQRLGLVNKYDQAIINNELWKNMTEYPCFEISNHGRIRNNKGILKLFFNKKINRFQYRFNTIGNVGTIQIHRFVAIYFNNPPNNYKNMQVHHINFDSCDNYYENLQWLTKEEHILIHKQNIN